MASTIESVKNTFSSWDSCMSKTYCKWPVIAAIIIGSLIALSLIWCCARCLCCGVECCCGCCACCNSCCPSPRGGRSRGGGEKNGGYQQAPPTPFGNGGYPGGYGGQYAPPQPMNTGYFGARGGVPSTATFESSARIHEDSLPPMPSWDTATSKRVEQRDEEVEMEKLQPSHQQQEVGLLANHHDGRDERFEYGNRQEAGDLGAGGMHATPYHDYTGQQHQQQQQGMSPYGGQRSPDSYAPGAGYASQAPYRPVVSPVASSPVPFGSSAGYSPAPYGSSAGYTSPAPYGSSADYFSGEQQQQPSQHRGYAPSVAAPSYHTRDVASPTSPGQQQQSYQAFGRKPVQGSWREV